MVASRVRSVLLVLLALGLFGCDEATKTVARERLSAGSVEIVRGAVELRYVQNDDIAFSAFRQLGVAHSPALLAALALAGIVMAIGLAIAAKRWSARVGLALVIGGALGNLADRVLRGYVVDFIHVQGWPVFNVADIAVVVGIGILFLARLGEKDEPPTVTPTAA